MKDKSGTITIPLYEPSLKYWQGGVVFPHDMNDVDVTINALMPEATQIARPKKLKREDGQIPRDVM